MTKIADSTQARYSLLISISTETATSSDLFTVGVNETLWVFTTPHLHTHNCVLY